MEVNQDWQGSELVSERLLSDITEALYEIVTNHVPLVKKMASDPTQSVYPLRDIMKKWTGSIVCGNRERVINQWKSMISLYLPDFDEEIVTLDYKSIPNEFICPVTNLIETDWWVTNSGDSISGECLKGIFKSGRTVTHPITKMLVKYVFLNKEKMLRLRSWAKENYPDLNDIYNDKYIHIPNMDNLAICTDRITTRNFSYNVTGFKSLLLLLKKPRSKKLPLSVLLDKSLDHKFGIEDNLPIIVEIEQLDSSASIVNETIITQAFNTMTNTVAQSLINMSNNPSRGGSSVNGSAGGS